MSKKEKPIEEKMRQSRHMMPQAEDNYVRMD